MANNIDTIDNIEQQNTKKWNVIVVGGGPSGMMAAITAAEKGAEVILIEKNDTLGKKLLITGGGRCNVTNSEFDNRKLLQKFKDNGKFLFSAFSQWSVIETLDFFHINKMDTKVENELRTFPVSNSAQSVWNVLIENLKKYNITIMSNAPVNGILKNKEKLIGVELKNKTKIFGSSIIIATGGTSRPETGSTGDAYSWLKDIGHNVITPEPSLVPIAIKDKWLKQLAGISLSNIKLAVFQNNQKQIVEGNPSNKKGSKLLSKILFTHIGVSGPTILNMSKDIGELLKYGPVVISIDLIPTMDPGALNVALQKLFKINDKKKFQNTLPDFFINMLSNPIPAAIAPIIIQLSGIDKDVKCNSITREERIQLITLLKALPMNVEKLLGIDKAIITSGGVILDEIDFKTMRSRIYPNLYLIGDILNIDRPSGGYSLQLCWTTGHVAGTWAYQPTAKQ